MHHAQSECMRVKAPTFLLNPKKQDSVLGTLRYKKQVTMLFQESACSVYAPSTARMLARKSTYMIAGGHKVDSVFETFRCASMTQYLPTKALTQ